MTISIPPFMILMIGALFIPFLRGRLKSAYILLLPLAGIINLMQLPYGELIQLEFLGYDIVPLKVDRLSLVWGYIFHIVTFIGMLYCMHFRNNVEYVFGALYAGAANGVVFAGDLFTFFAFWEMLTVTAVFLILERRTRAALGAGFRYAMVHVVGGLFLLAGIILYVDQVQSVELGKIGLSTLPTYLIFIGIGFNCAWPVLHAWLTDAYPESTIGGVIFLSAFTTKTAVYAMARTFPGTETLMWIGAAMTAFPVFFAVIENDLRRVLSYSLINQVGFMLVGVGIGTELALNGASAHAFTHILYKALLFMAIGAVMHQTGRSKCTDLGGLYRTMPFTCACCIIGAASISAVPLFSGFISKSMVVSAAAEGHMIVIWFMLLFASAGVFEHAGIKVPFFAFFAHDSGLRPKEAPINMRLAMGITAFLCVAIGMFPHATVYQILPFEVDYHPYTAEHVITQAQLLLFAGLAFALLLLAGIYPAEIPSKNLDSDWFYRKGSRRVYQFCDWFFNGLNSAVHGLVVNRFTRGINDFATDAPARVANFLLRPIWGMEGLDSSEIGERQQKVAETIRGTAIPIGYSAMLVTLMFTLMYLL